MIGTMLLMLASGAGDLPNLAWLEGEWCTDPANGRQTCEIWGPARGGTMLGFSQTVRDGRTRDYEFMRIELTDGAAVFHASPRGAAPSAFSQSTREATGITFANAGHDYPQRIRYWRRGADLLAEIALADGSKPMRWTYRRVR
jgi:hypothetical protein